MIADDWLAIVVHINTPAYQMDAQAARMRRMPGVVRHLFASRRQPSHFRRMFASQRFSMKESATVKHRLVVVELDHVANKV